MPDWHPTIQLDSGLKKTIDYFKDIVEKIDVEVTLEKKAINQIHAIHEMV